MNKQLPKSNCLAARLSGYAASAGAMLALYPAVKGQIIYSGSQNIELNMPDEYVEIDLNGDLVYDFAFQLYGSVDFYTYYSWNYVEYSGFAAIRNLGNFSYPNSWLVGLNTVVHFYYTTYRSMPEGLNSGDSIDKSQLYWMNSTYIGWPGFLARGSIFYYYNTYSGTSGSDYWVAGDFIGQEKYVGVRFFIDDEQHYGWIRVSLAENMDPLTIIDWAYESQPGMGLDAGEGLDDTPPLITFNIGDDFTHERTKEVILNSEERILGLIPGDFIVDNGSVTKLRVIEAGRSYGVEVTADAKGTVELILPAGSVEDESANQNEEVSTNWNYLGPDAIEIASQEISVFPNPVSDNLYIELNKTSDIQILSSGGLTIYMNKGIINEIVDVSRFTPGLYILQVRSEDQITQHKIIIE